ncbi:AGR146Wp [Eremothecium gossypii ATCC 10895]|uniref:AGR146Wp n=1 Tax=Eremothecium gossypii (strain ATCC 10895 / CBS 109.51 / FGSC 9923 / NRRL Y-1056) TaxID=284811 RepID=Q74ZQ2_EREGS|nr:AGR146Wp [Eremothecium gossypii ATCC 10895]AAS54636.1 AGR146Wp [Eremothecium gossypii ATCC 10895]AEY98966.1 FAGR146Wp [Eremothecium gossypii FDAG1]
MRLPFKYTRAQLELFRFSFCLLAPVGVMYYIGTDTDRKLNVPGFWPDPESLNKIPKEKYEIQAELARMRKERLEKRLRLERRLAEEFGLDVEAEKAKLRQELAERGAAAEH